MRLPRRLILARSPRTRRALVPLTALGAALLAVGTSSAAAGHGIAESATYHLPAVPAHVQADGAGPSTTAGLTPFTLTSADFTDGGRLPAWTEFGGPYASEAGCYGKNQSPELSWANVPAGTKSFALFVHDNDAPQSWGWTHWITYNIPGTVSSLPRNDDTAYTPGTTDWQANGIPQVGYGGPCPPADGETHHYLFTLYALSTPDISTAGLDYADLQNAMAPYVLGATSIVGTYCLP